MKQHVVPEHVLQHAEHGGCGIIQQVDALGLGAEPFDVVSPFVVNPGNLLPELAVERAQFLPMAATLSARDCVAVRSVTPDLTSWFRLACAS